MKEYDLRIDNKIGTIFTFKKINENNEVVQTVGPFCNMVLDQGLDNLYDTIPGLLINYIKVGSGSTPVSASDTDLTSPVATTNTLNDTLERGGNVRINQEVYSFIRRNFKFNIGDITSTTDVDINEVGLCKSDGELFNKQILPETVVITSTTGLVIETETRLYSGMYLGVPLSGSFDFNAAEITYNKYVNDIYPMWSSNSANYSPFSESSFYIKPYSLKIPTVLETHDLRVGTTPNTITQVGSYVPGSFECTMEYVWNPGKYIGDINTITIGNNDGRGQEYSLLLDSTILLTDLEELKFTLKYNWGRYNELLETSILNIDFPTVEEFIFGSDNNGYEGLNVIGSPSLSSDFVSFDGIGDGLAKNTYGEAEYGDLFHWKFKIKNKNKGVNQVISSNAYYNPAVFTYGWTLGIDTGGNLGFFTENDSSVTVPISAYSDDVIYNLFYDNTNSELYLYDETIENLIYSAQSPTLLEWIDYYNNTLCFGYGKLMSNISTFLGDPSYFEGDIYFMKTYSLIDYTVT